jgi:drug/metabolite transporter (DMT)-like permease
MSQKSKKSRSIKSKLSTKNNQNAVNEKIEVETIHSVKRNKMKKAPKLDDCKKSVSKYLGFFLAFCATFCLTISYFIIKLSKSLNAAEMGSIKFLLTTICCLFVSMFYKQNILGPKDSRYLLLARGLTGSIALVLNFFSIQLITYGDSTVIRNISPVVTAIFARIFLKEILNVSHFLSLFISFIGIMFVARPPVIFGKFLNSTSVKIDNNFILGVSLAIISTLAIGLAFIFIKKLTNKNVHFSVIIFYLSSIGCMISLITSITLYLTEVSHKEWELEKEFLTRDISLALTAGILNFLGHICFTLAFLRENANTISIMRTLGIYKYFC